MTNSLSNKCPKLLIATAIGQISDSTDDMQVLLFVLLGWNLQLPGATVAREFPPNHSKSSASAFVRGLWLRGTLSTCSHLFQVEKTKLILQFSYDF